MHWDLYLERTSQNKLPQDANRRRLKEIADAAGRNKSLGFCGKVGRLGEPESVMDENKQEVYRYVVKLRLVKKAVRSEDAARKQLEHVVAQVRRAAEARDWKLLAELVREATSETGGLGAVRNEPRPDFRVPELTADVMTKHFGDVYERDEHVRTIHAAVELSVLTGGEVTSHVLLYGLPGGCKTQLMERFKSWYEAASPGAERVSFVDCTTMTKAGIERWILEMAEGGALPEVIVLDEIEKVTDWSQLLTLLSLMGSGTIARLNAHIGNCRQRARFVCVGICNNEEKIRGWNAGALWSRFGGNKLPCVRPSRELCLKILGGMVAKIPGGDPRWAEEALRFGYDELGQRDIREIKDHLAGRHRLLSGGWQRDRREMLRRKLEEERQIEMAGSPKPAPGL